MTSSNAVDKPLVKRIDTRFSKKLLTFNGFEIIGSVGLFHKTRGFDRYNRLLDINGMFSNSPLFDPVDRTGRISGPVRFHPGRAWQIPQDEINLETALEMRVRDLCQRDDRINIFWSGGIDSTAIVVAFLKYANDTRRLRIIYAPWSTYEHPEFFKMLQSISNIEMLDISGEVYLTYDLDGIMISGNTGDEMHASLDESFFNGYGYGFLSSPWRDFFWSKLPDDAFIDFCEEYFSASGFDIKTVLEARWWFYASSKLTSILNFSDLGFFSSGKKIFDPNRLVGFYDCDAYERFIYFNIDRLIESDRYSAWRQFLKDFCHAYDGFDDWHINKEKFNSTQLRIYTAKKRVLNDTRNLMILADGQRVATPNLPFFNKRDWDQIKQDYQYVFRSPDTV